MGAVGACWGVPQQLLHGSKGGHQKKRELGYHGWERREERKEKEDQGEVKMQQSFVWVGWGGKIRWELGGNAITQRSSTGGRRP